MGDVRRLGPVLLGANDLHLWDAETRVCALCHQHEDSASAMCPHGHQLAELTITGTRPPTTPDR